MKELFEKVCSLKDTLLELIANEKVIIIFLIVVNLLVMAVWIYGLVSGLAARS